MFCTPSRNRPHRVAELLAACRQTGTVAPFEICLDPDDPQLEYYRALPLMPGWQIWVADRPMKVCDHLRAFYHRHPDLPWYGIMGDDALPRTPQWDQILVEIAGNDAVSYPNDVVQVGQCTHPVIGGDLMRAVGWFVPDGFIHWYCDTVWEFLGWRTRRLLYCREVIVEHICPRRTDMHVPDDETSLNLWTLPDGTKRSEEDDKRRWLEFVNNGEADAALQRIVQYFNAPHDGSQKAVSEPRTGNSILNVIPSCGDVLYVGAHNGQEVPQIMSIATGHIALFEPQTLPYERLKSWVPDHVTVLKKAVSDAVGTANLFIASNEESSSLRRMTGHKKHHPDIEEINVETVEVTTLDHEGLGCDLLVLDVQGNEMAALRGATKTLEKTRFIMAEYGTEELYEGQETFEQMTQWLAERGFVHLFTEARHETWGNALYVRNDQDLINQIMARYKKIAADQPR